MRETELRQWIEELAEDQGEKERQQIEQKERERQVLKERRQRWLETLRERFGKEGVEHDLLETLLGFDKQFSEESEAEIEEQRDMLIEQGEDVDIPNETAALLDGAMLQSIDSSAIDPYYVEIRGNDGGLEHSEYHPNSINVRVNKQGRDEFFRTERRTVNWWFSFTPDETRNWDFRIAMPYRGFRLQRVEEGLSTVSRVDIDEEYRVHQYNPGPVEEVKRVGEWRSEANEFTRIDRVFSGHYTHVLGRGDQALLHVHQRFMAHAQGPGTRAELNFSTGVGNRLPAPYLHVH